MNNVNKLYVKELEELTGKIFTGNVTPLVYHILKDTKDLPELLKVLTGEESVGERTDSMPKPVVSFDDWFKEQLIITDRRRKC